LPQLEPDQSKLLSRRLICFLSFSTKEVKSLYQLISSFVVYFEQN